MAKLDGLETVLDFLKGLQPKIAAQIAKKVMSLNIATTLLRLTVASIFSLDA